MNEPINLDAKRLEVARAHRETETLLDDLSNMVLSLQQVNAALEKELAALKSPSAE